jgi:hypothetical protein
MDELSNILTEATRSIEPGYFRLNIDGGDPVYRERVYCYELYHQMRLKWPAGCSFCLNGEIDKASHPILSRLGADYAKPDLLVHSPGHMSGNHAIIEVKSTRASPSGIKKDIATLSLFRSAVRYERAIYLIYGDRIDAMLRRIQRAAAIAEDLAPIELWLHERAGEPAVRGPVLAPSEMPLA